MRFAAMVSLKQPEELLKGLMELKVLMLSTFNEKDVSAKAFEDYLNQVDDDYLRLVAEQKNEIDDILVFTRKSIKELQQKCQSAVDQTEATLNAERERFIKQKEGELDALRQEIQ